MYLTHFGFTHYPFERALLPDELFASSAAREAQARLQHLIEARAVSGSSPVRSAPAKRASAANLT